MIINDSFMEHGDVPYLEGTDNSVKEFNKKVAACVNMYRFLEKEGVLKKISFRYDKYKGHTNFAFDTEELKPYQKLMEASNVKDAKVAIKHIFNEDVPRCNWCNAVTKSWTMNTYRDNNGVIGRSVECGMCQCFGLDIISEAHQKKNTKEKVSFIWDNI